MSEHTDPTADRMKKTDAETHTSLADEYGVDGLAGLYFGVALMNAVSALASFVAFEFLDGTLSSVLAGIWAAVGVRRARRNRTRGTASK